MYWRRKKKCTTAHFSRAILDHCVLSSSIIMCHLVLYLHFDSLVMYLTCSIIFLVAGSGSSHFGSSRIGAAAAWAHRHDGVFWALSSGRSVDACMRLEL